VPSTFYICFLELCAFSLMLLAVVVQFTKPNGDPSDVSTQYELTHVHDTYFPVPPPTLASMGLSTRYPV